MKLSIMTFLCFFPSLVFAQIQWGNGGEGFQIDGKTYVRDLVESNVHLDPYIGDSQLSLLIEGAGRLQSLKTLGLDLSLLGRKLSDLELQKIGLGYFVLETLRNYNWAFSPALDLAPDNSPVLPGSPMRVPLAKRFQNTVKFDIRFFPSLSAEHKIALVIHEAIFALLKPRNEYGDLECRYSPCKQSDFIVRSMVGYLFNRNHYPCRDMGRCLDEYSIGELNVDWKATDNLYVQKIQITLENTDGSLDQIFDVDPLRWNFEELAFNKVKNFCEGMYAESSVRKGWHRNEVVAYMHRYSFDLKLIRYRALESPQLEPFQLGAQIVYRDPLYLNMFDFVSYPDCFTTLQSVIHKHFVAQ